MNANNVAPSEEVERRSRATGLRASSEEVIAHGEELKPQSGVSGLLAYGEKVKLARCLARAILALGFSLVSACATTPREKILQNILIATATGVVLGQLQTNHKNAYSIMYGGIAGTGAGIASAYLSNIDEVQRHTHEENQKLKNQLDDILKPKLSYQTLGTLNSKIPLKYKNLVNPGEWKVFEIDQWVEDSENRLIHQDKIMELIPPTLNPNQTRSN